jgi:hypothetical protein
MKLPEILTVLDLLSWIAFRKPHSPPGTPLVEYIFSTFQHVSSELVLEALEALSSKVYRPQSLGHRFEPYAAATTEGSCF